MTSKLDRPYRGRRDRPDVAYSAWSTRTYTDPLRHRAVRPIRMVAGEMLERFDSVIHDWAQGNPPGQRGRAPAERVDPNRNMREVPASVGAGFINRAQTPFQEHAPLGRRPQDS